MQIIEGSLHKEIRQSHLIMTAAPESHKIARRIELSQNKKKHSYSGTLFLI